MGQVFVPSVGLNQQQALAQNTAQVNTKIVNQVQPVDSLKGLFKLFDTTEKRLDTLDKLQMQAEAQELRDDLQQRLSANRDELLQKKGKAALDFKKEYEDLNTKAYQEVSNKVQDPRIRSTLKVDFDHTLAAYQAGSNSYLSQQTAQLALNQAKASVQNSSNNVIDQTVSGTPQQQKESLSQLDTDQDHLTYLTGGDPNGVDGKVARQQAHDEIAKGVVNHYIDHDAFSAGDAYLASISKRLNTATRVALEDDLYLARQKYAGASGAGGKVSNLPNRSSWVKTTAENIFNADMAAATDEQRNDPLFVNAIRSSALARANNSFEKMQKRVKATEDFNTSVDLAASDAYAYSQKYGTILGTNEKISYEVASDPTNILGRLPKQLQQAYLQRFNGDVDKANENLATIIMPPDLLGNYDKYKDYLANPEMLRARYSNERALKLGLQQEGLGLPLISKLAEIWNKQQKDYQTKQDANIVKSAIHDPSFQKGILADDKKVNADPRLQTLDYAVSNRAQVLLQQLRESDPNLNEFDLISRLSNQLENDQSIKFMFAHSAQIDEKIDTLRAFDERLSKYSKPFLRAVQATFPNDFGIAMAQDVYAGMELIDNLAVTCLKNDAFKKKYSHLEEVQDADSYITWSNAQKQEQTPFAQDLASILDPDEYKKFKESQREPTDNRDK